jgi:hypothetical protein
MPRLCNTLNVVIAAFVVALVASGCAAALPGGSQSAPTEFTSPPSSAPYPTSKTTLASTSTIPSPRTISLTAQQIAAGSVKASQDADSFAFDMDFSMSLKLPAGGQFTSMSLQQTGSGSTNVPARQMSMAMTMTIEMTNQGNQAATGDIYFSDGWTYIRTPSSGGVDQWTKTKLTDELWAAQRRLASTADLLESPINVEVIASEFVRGVDCYVLAITPDMNALSSWAGSQTFPGQITPGVGGSDLAKTLQTFTVKEWIAKDGLLPAKAVVSIKLDTTSGAPSGTSGMAMEMNTSITFRDYGRPVVIQLPSAALNARELTTAK